LRASASVLAAGVMPWWLQRQDVRMTNGCDDVACL
jgi:hypothetical protein